MNHEELLAEAKHLSAWQRHKFMVLVAATIAVSLLLVTVSMWLYSTSGAAQLDLSRPGYEKERSQASKSKEFTSFPATGPIDKAALDEFRKLYDKQLKEATAVDSFGGNVMSDAALGIDAPAEE